MIRRVGKKKSQSQLRQHPVVPGTPLHDLLMAVAREIVHRQFTSQPSALGVKRREDDRKGSP